MNKLLGFMPDGSPLVFDTERWQLKWSPTDSNLPGLLDDEPDERGDGGIISDAAAMLERHAHADKDRVNE